MAILSPAEPLTVLTSALVDDAGFPPEELDMVQPWPATGATGPRAAQCSPTGSSARSPGSTSYAPCCGTMKSCRSSSWPANTDTEQRLGAIRQEPRLRVAGLETRLPASATEHATSLDVVDSIVRSFPGLAAFVEIGAGPECEQALNLLAGRGRMAKARCGGARPELFPAAADLARFILGTAERGLPFKATAGLHHAVGYRDGATGFEHFGFLNVLLAVADAQAGLDTRHLQDTLNSRDARAIADRAAALDTATATTVRAAFAPSAAAAPADRWRTLPRSGSSPPSAPNQSKGHPHDRLPVKLRQRLRNPAASSGPSDRPELTQNCPYGLYAE